MKTSDKELFQYNLINDEPFLDFDALKEKTENLIEKKDLSSLDYLVEDTGEIDIDALLEIAANNSGQSQ